MRKSSTKDKNRPPKKTSFREDTKKEKSSKNKNDKVVDKSRIFMIYLVQQTRCGWSTSSTSVIDDLSAYRVDFRSLSLVRITCVSREANDISKMKSIHMNLKLFNSLFLSLSDIKPAQENLIRSHFNFTNVNPVPSPTAQSIIIK